MKKRILFAILGLLIVIAVLAGVKSLQIRTMVEHGKKAVLPPDTVTTAAARSESWETSLSAVGSLTAVQGVTVAAELAAKVVEIAFEPGAKVKRGDLLIRQDTSVEEAQLPGAEAQVTLTESVLARDVLMLKDKIISQADYDAAVAGHRQAMAQVETLRATIAKKTIRAPFAGRLGIRLVNLGQTLREGDPIVTLQSLDPIYVDFALPQQELSRLTPAFGAGHERRAARRGDRRPHHHREPAVDADTRNVQLQATVANPEEKLRPGMFVNVAVVLPVRKKVTVHPGHVGPLCPLRRLGLRRRGREGR